MLRVDAVWRSTQALDRRAGPETALARVVQADMPAGPDGFRWRSSHLNIELDALMSYRSVPVPGPTCLFHHTRGRLLSFKAVV